MTDGGAAKACMSLVMGKSGRCDELYIVLFSGFGDCYVINQSLAKASTLLLSIVLSSSNSNTTHTPQLKFSGLPKAVCLQRTPPNSQQPV
jgi:hypothetical protein